MDDIQLTPLKLISNTIAPSSKDCARRLIFKSNDEDFLASDSVEVIYLKDSSESTSPTDNLKDTSGFPSTNFTLPEQTSVNGKENLASHSQSHSSDDIFVENKVDLERESNDKNGDESVGIHPCPKVDGFGTESNETFTECNINIDLAEDVGSNHEGYLIESEENYEEKWHLNVSVVQSTLQESILPNEYTEQLSPKVVSTTDTTNGAEFAENTVNFNKVNNTRETSEKLFNKNITPLSKKSSCSSRTPIDTENKLSSKHAEGFPLKSNDNYVKIKIAPKSPTTKDSVESPVIAKNADYVPEVKFKEEDDWRSPKKNLNSLQSSCGKEKNQNKLSPFCEWELLIKRPSELKKDSIVKNRVALNNSKENESPNMTKEIVSHGKDRELKEKCKANNEAFISDNPCENDDNNNPEWEVLKKLETDEERYKAVRRRWRNLTIPDPNKNLTFIHVKSCFKPPLPCERNPESRNLGDSSHECNQPTSRKRTLSYDPSTSTKPAPAKRARTRSCTTSYDLKVQSHKKRMEEEERKIVSEKSKALSKSRSEYNKEWSRLMASNLKYHNYPEYQIRLQRLHSNQRQLVDSIRRTSSGALCELEDENRKKLLMFKNAMKEVETFHKFYQKLDKNSTKNDCFFLTENELDDVFEIDKLYERFNNFYS